MAKATKKKYIYKVRNTKTGDFLASWSYFDKNGNEFKTEAGARKAVEYFINNTLNKDLGRSVELINESALKKHWNYELEIVKIEIIHTVDSILSLANNVRQVIMQRKIDAASYKVGTFWRNAIYKGYADQIEYVIVLNSDRTITRKQQIMEARSHLRNLGVKTRTFREYEGMFGFYNKDQALKARLTLDGVQFIDIADIRKQLFG